jgi:hypothetical protein
MCLWCVCVGGGGGGGGGGVGSLFFSTTAFFSFPFQVTSTGFGRVPVPASPGQLGEQLISQVFGSACSVAYSTNRASLWEPLSRLVLDASYESTLHAALHNAARRPDDPRARIVFLTELGGGAFGNDKEWIGNAIARACSIFQHVGLDVRIVEHSVESPVHHC